MFIRLFKNLPRPLRPDWMLDVTAAPHTRMQYDLIWPRKDKIRGLHCPGCHVHRGSGWKHKGNYSSLMHPSPERSVYAGQVRDTVQWGVTVQP